MILAAGAAACSADGGRADTAQYCMGPQDCPADQTCLGGVCGRECMWDEDCGDTLRFLCKEMKCEPVVTGYDVHDGDAGLTDATPPLDTGDAVEVPCEKDLDCDPYQMACIDGVCDRECTKDEHCGDPGRYCYAYRCFDKEADPAPGDVTDPPDATPDAAVDSDGPKKAYGQACAAGTECEGGFCLQIDLAGNKICTQPCPNQSPYECPGLDICYGFPMGGGVTEWVCIPNDAGQSCGACLSAIELQSGTGQCICSVKCDSAEKCPNEMACAPVLLSGQQTKVCMPIGAQCDPQAMATYTSNCFGICYPTNPAATTGFCSASCSGNNDCPTGYTCHAEVIEGQTIRTCQ